MNRKKPIDQSGDTQSEFTIRWILTHDPIALFEEAARRFASLVSEKSGGRIAVQVMTPTEYGKEARVSADEVARRVANGELEMSQTYSTVLGKLHHKLWALDLPFLFESHEHAAEVLDGRMGRDLLEGLSASGLRGLAFTYSGGYRIISATEREIHDISDLVGLRIRTSDNPVVRELFDRLGAHPHPAPLQAIPSLTEGHEIDAAESTWPRYWDMEHYRAQGIVNETSHSLFLTTLVMNETFYQRLPDELQQVVHDVALETARMERQKSIDDARTARSEHIAAGGRVITLSPEAKHRFQSSVGLTYDRFIPEFGRKLIDEIQSAALETAS